MAILNVNPTRMELTNLKRRLITARRGHKLLKDKRDELMRQFLELVRENQSLRAEVESAVGEANKKMAVARSVVPDEILDTALMLPKQELSLEIDEKNVMSVIIPSYRVGYKTNNPNDIYSYGYAYTSGETDGAILSLAEVEKSCQLMSAEIEKTRRRVNALEHVMIPQYEETIKYISMKLDENERSTTTRVMKVKDMMIKEVVEEKHEAEQRDVKKGTDRSRA